MKHPRGATDPANLDVVLLIAFHEQMQNTFANLAALSRPDCTAALTRGVTRLFLDLGLAPLQEFKLANGRRADIAGVDRAGRISFVEIKSCRADFESDDKWPEYLGFCDHFYFAVAPDFPLSLLPEGEGLILADAYDASIRQPARERKLAAARRKAVTLRFARQCALRLA